MSKAKTLMIFGAGYVLGAQAGRARYEELKRRATLVAEHPKTKQIAQQAREKVGSRLPSSLSRRSDADAAAAGAGVAGAGVPDPIGSDPTVSTIDLTDTSDSTPNSTTRSPSVGGPSHL